jgi:hypothetical protein
MSCFNCSCERHVANDCRQKPTYRGRVCKDIEHKSGVSRGIDNLNKAQSKGWSRSGNDELELSRNRQLPAETKTENA